MKFYIYINRYNFKKYNDILNLYETIAFYYFHSITLNNLNITIIYITYFIQNISI